MNDSRKIDQSNNDNLTKVTLDTPLQKQFNSINYALPSKVSLLDEKNIDYGFTDHNACGNAQQGDIIQNYQELKTKYDEVLAQCKDKKEENNQERLDEDEKPCPNDPSKTTRLDSSKMLEMADADERVFQLLNLFFRLWI